tara:strand:+ start:100404 stop:101354 length:951 start_codon:yes stop_codon:yes gene_type:complete
VPDRRSLQVQKKGEFVETQFHTQQKNTASDKPPTCPDLFYYMDYRKFLEEWFSYKKDTNPSYSGSMFARQAGLSSHTLLSMVIRGKRNLGISSLQGFIKALKLNAKESRYFEKLVLYNQSKKNQEKHELLSELAKINKNKQNEKLHNLSHLSQFLDSWDKMAIRELVCLADFEADPDWIAKKLKNKITKKQAEAGFKMLKELDLVVWSDSKKKYTLNRDALEIDPRELDFAVQNYHSKMLERTQQALEEDRWEDREFSSLTLAVTQNQLKDIKEKINTFRKELNADLSSTPGNKDEVVAINIQLINLTNPLLEDPK